MIGRRARYTRLAGQIALVAVCAVVPAVVCQYFEVPPRERYIHVEAFRYGKDPSVIRCNRGDILHLTFSTRDYWHSLFLEEFDIDVKIQPGTRTVQVFGVRDPSELRFEGEEVVLEARYPGRWPFLFSKFKYMCHIYCGPLHGFEAGVLIIRPNTLLYASMGALVGVVVAFVWGSRRRTAEEELASAKLDRTRGWDLLGAFPWLRRLLKWRGFQVAFIYMALLGLVVVIIALLTGTKQAGRNLGAMLTWIVWLFLLTVIFIPVGGRVWCMACPLPFFGEVLQRMAIIGVRTARTGSAKEVSCGRMRVWVERVSNAWPRLSAVVRRVVSAVVVGSTAGTNNRFFGLNRCWPGWLSNAWPRLFVFLTIGSFSTVVVATPRVGGWLLVGMVAVPLVMALIWRLRTFCLYLCPVRAFDALYGMMGVVALRGAKPEICARCKVRTCQMGNARGWACPYGLCVGEIADSKECGMCMECIKSCAYDNVTLRVRPFAEDLRMHSVSEAWLAMVMFVLAVAYSLTHLGHWAWLRDWVNVVDKDNWHLLAMYAGILWTVGLVVFPAVFYGVVWLGHRLARPRCTAWSLFIQSTTVLVPLGLFVWICFVVPNLFVHVTFIRQSLSDPLGWGWRFLEMEYTPWHQFIPQWIPWIQAVCLLVGLAYSLRNARRMWVAHTGSGVVPLRGIAPLGGLLVVFAGSLMWFFVN